MITIVPIFANAQGNELSEDELINQISAIDTKKIGEFIEKMQELNKQTEYYVKQRADECSGDIITFEPNDKGEKIEKTKKLTSKEKSQCLIRLIRFRKRIAKIMYQVRFKNLKELHKMQEADLIKSQQNSLKELEDIEQQYKR